MRVLLVEDDEMIGEAVVDGLKSEGYAVCPELICRRVSKPL